MIQIWPYMASGSLDWIPLQILHNRRKQMIQNQVEIHPCFHRNILIYPLTSKMAVGDDHPFKGQVTNSIRMISIRYNRFLPPVYKVWGKVLFSQVSVCSHFREGTPSKVQAWGVPCPRSRLRGSPFQIKVGGYPIPGPGGGTPSQMARWGYPVPDQVQAGGLPHPRCPGRRYPIPGPGRGVIPSLVSRWEVTHPRSRQRGYPIPGVQVGGTPCQVKVGLPWGTWMSWILHRHKSEWNLSLVSP